MNRKPQRSLSILATALLGFGTVAHAAPLSPVPNARGGKPAAPSEAPESPPPQLIFPDAAHRATQPKPAQPGASELPKPMVWKLKNGIEVLLVERHQLPTVSMELVVPGGTADDPAGQEGLASVCMELVGEGTQALDKVAFSEALADVGSAIGSQAGVDESGVSMATLRQHLDATLALWLDTLRKPGLREGDFSRLVQLRRAGLKALQGNPASVAGRLTPSVAWGAQHAYARFATDAAYAALLPDGCKTWLGKRMQPQGARLYVVGDITRAELDVKLGPLLGAWQGKASKPTAIGKATPRKGKVFFVDMPGAEQAVVAVVHGNGPQRKVPEHQAVMLMASILGGGFSSRINMNIREKHGYAYGASGGYGYTRTGSTFTAQASVRNDATGASIVEILREMRGMLSGAPSDSELTREKEGAILALPARWSTGRSILGTFQGLQYFGLPLDDYENYIPRVQAVDAKKVQAVAKAWLRPDAVQILVVGDGASVRPQLEKLVTEGELKGGQIVTLDVDGAVRP